MRDGVGSAREVCRLTEAHDAYRWLCGGVQVNHHSVSDFRRDHGKALDEPLSISVASLMAAGVAKLKAVAQDSMRVRATCWGQIIPPQRQAGRLPGGSAPPNSVKRACLGSKRSSSAKARAPLKRASMTDAEATVMKMGDGGFRPAYNPQLAADAELGHRRGAGGHAEQRPGTEGADDRAGERALWACPGCMAGRWRLRRARADRTGEPDDHDLWAGKGSTARWHLRL